MELGKLKFELFYLSKVVLGSDRIKMLFNQLDFRQKPCYPVRGEKEDLTHRYQKKNFRVGVVEHWNRLPREVEEIPSLELFKKSVDMENMV